MFYGATDVDTAIAEIGAHSSYTHAVVGEFTPVRELRLLNLAGLNKLPKPSLFDQGQHKAFFATKFLREFVADLTKPIELDGREHIDYVPTQVFTEYLKTAHPGRLDGLMFPSAQNDSGSNVVIFCGPEHCASNGSEGKYSRLSLDPATVVKYRVTTVIRRSGK
ncbi:hypothetical protein GCM10007304_46710 [Rhodococcoides trifolii]|uniref:RES domain-containing protein n=2 Tax=Rhodococcoides trifolii TaxID=908250 RepID=A0A917LIP0_9NOCA|nr:hypothetical protein GCM10007304_46710 [Rhodococcus trifolii]